MAAWTFAARSGGIDVIPCAVFACAAPLAITSAVSLPSATKLHPGIRSPHLSTLDMPDLLWPIALLWQGPDVGPGAAMIPPNARSRAANAWCRDASGRRAAGSANRSDDHVPRLALEEVFHVLDGPKETVADDL